MEKEKEEATGRSI